MQSTQQIAVTLSLNIVTQTGNDTQLVTLPFVRLTPFIFWLWSVWQFGYVVSQVITETIEPLRLWGKVVSIGFISLAFGLGLKL
jgi:hypothetical protein